MDGADDTKTNPENRPSESASPIIVPPNDTDVLSHAEAQPPHNDEHESANSAPQTKLVEWLQFIANAILAVIGIIAICIYGGQLRVMKGQLDQMIAQYPQLQKSAQGAQDAATAANTAANNSSVALRQSETAFITEQRPYLVTTIPEFNQTLIVGNQDITANITFVNIGRTPARKIFRNIKMSPYHASDRKSFIRFIDDLFADLRNKDSKGRKEIATTRNAEIDIAPQATQFSTNTAITIPPEDVAALANESGPNVGKMSLFYVGVASYTDAFGSPYKTEFCYFDVGTNLKIWHICDNHNTIQ